MKKQFILTALFFTIVTAASAQVSGFGFRPAMTLSRYKLDKSRNDLYDAALRPGASLSAFMEINLGNRFTLQPEVAFSQRGANIVSESTLYWPGTAFGYPRTSRVLQHKEKEALNYIDIPVMVERNFGGGSVGAYLAAGPGASFAIGGRGIEELTIQAVAGEESANDKTDRNEYTIEMGSGRNDTYKGFDLNLNAGGGIIFLMDSGELSIDLRYTHGVRALDKDGLRNRNFMVGVSYMFYIGH
jgi:Outer membrane protein beta-barrel domain